MIRYGCLPRPAPPAAPEVQSMRPRSLSLASASLTLLWLVSASTPAGESHPTPGQLEFFEKSVRPVLSAHCLRCHGPDRHKGGLRLDSRAAALAGGDTG